MTSDAMKGGFAAPGVGTERLVGPALIRCSGQGRPRDIVRNVGFGVSGERSLVISTSRRVVPGCGSPNGQMELARTGRGR